MVWKRLLVEGEISTEQKRIGMIWREKRMGKELKMRILGA